MKYKVFKKSVTDRQTYRQTYSQTDSHTDRQTDKPIHRGALLLKSLRENHPPFWSEVDPAQFCFLMAVLIFFLAASLIMDEIVA